MERVYRFFGETEETRRIRKHKIENTHTSFDEPIRECTACLVNIEDLEVVQLQPCTHIVHRACMHAWTYRKELLGQDANCPVCNADITHITYIADGNSQNVTHTLVEYMNNYNNLMNMRFTARELFNAIPTIQEFLQHPRLLMQRPRRLPGMILHDILFSAIAYYIISTTVNAVTNSLNPDGGKSRKAKKAKKTKKTRKRRKVRKH
jgi:hypothetical protein